ncbi:helix-turn-helix domain-containing protein [Nocardia sp. NPDC050710]|uniref:helix-turn-helix domain-containing protein n=1 Tax=Nocardia sp. NPDC050710 TaxID=3157220 RepID=UPI003409B80F
MQPLDTAASTLQPASGTVVIAMPWDHDDDSDDESCADIGWVIADFRRKARMSRRDLSAAVDISIPHLEKMERGVRTFTIAYLDKVAEALGVFPLAREHLVALASQPDVVRAKILAGVKLVPEPHDLAMLDAISTPACLLLPVTFDILAANDAFDRAYPGACQLGNLVLWMLTDEIAHQILPRQYWEQEAVLQVGAASCLWPGLLTRKRFEDFRKELSQVEDFQRFWDTRLPVDEVASKTIMIRDLETDTTTQMYRHTINQEFPDLRPWRLYMLTPVQPAESRAFMVPAGMARRGTPLLSRNGTATSGTVTLTATIART